MATTEKDGVRLAEKAEPPEDVGPNKPRRPTLALATALLALATGSIGLVFTFWPGLRPDPRVTQSATLRVAAVDPGISLREYLSRLNALPPNLPNSRACLPGNLYYVEERLEGFKSRTTALRFYLYNGRTRQRVKGALRSVSSVQAATIKSTRPTDQSISLVWAQWPERRGTFFIRFELYRKKTFLNLVDTPPFTLGKSTYGNSNVQCLASLAHAPKPAR
jgi:hypothetical protein